jgi:signal transduction histidine kinase
MSFIRSFFEINEPVIQFAYGLAFFAMGLAIALQSRSASRLELARSLAWLAAFGILHSLFEWGELFAPFHEAYLSPRGAENLHIAHLLFLSLSFICLFEFGVALLHPLGRGRWLHGVTLGLLAGYLLALLALPRLLPDPHTWHATADALARYFIGLPGGLLAAYGLREQAFRQIAPLEAPHIVKTLRITGVALFLYALFGGLIPPPVPFLPGSLLNTDSFEGVLGVPPLVFLSLIGLALALSTIRALEIFEVELERRIEQMEQQQIQAAERQRIARELHDSTIQTAYTAGLLVDSARKLAEPGSSIAGRLERAVSALNDVIHDLRRNLGELRAAPPAEPLSEALRRLAEDPRYRSLVNIDLDLQFTSPEELSPARKEHVLAIVNEALSNVVRHAGARQVQLSARQEDGQLRIAIQDDGGGFSGTPGAGFGLRNMRERARLLDGRLEISGERGKGTSVRLDIPVREEAARANVDPAGTSSVNLNR